MARSAAGHTGAEKRAGWSFLAVSVNNSLYTLNAFRPSNRFRLLFGWSFFASWVTIELAPFILAVEVLLGAWFV
ncbi:MAG TPA: hypothetical protein PKA87_14115, partial [Microthrixaceae bacterium]|nr:hypothetical protein [Microthrixaceae bacterium]